MAIVNEKKTVDNKTRLIELILKTKQLNLNTEDIKCFDKPELLFEYLKDDPDNVHFEYVVKFYAYGFGIDGFNSYEEIIKTVEIKDLDYKIIWYPEWRVRIRKNYIENLF